MNSPQPPYPRSVKAPHGARVMHIDWSDGHLGVYPHEVLRGYCPCAECQGHGPTISYHEGGNLELRDIATVGNYALSLSWGDGHDAGIYDFGLLRALCQCEACRAARPEGVRDMVFHRR